MRLPTTLTGIAALAATLLAGPAPAQDASSAGDISVDAPEKPPLKQEELDQLLAPIALYPDSLVSQILMASTYPIEVVEASRWQEKNKTLKGDALAKALEEQSWDPSVKSLVNFPDVLSMMNEKLDWTTKLGDAFISQQKDVLDTVQALRNKAQAQGNLKSNEQQNVKVEQADGGTQVIVIESSDPDVIYVPSYDPVVVYGAWPYPAYPPYYYYPPGYVAGTAALSFGLGVACGVAWGYAWGGCDWHQDNIDIDVDRNVNRNRNVDRSKARSGEWKHDGSHRKGAAYRDQQTAQKYGKGGSASAAKAREQYRGRAEQGQRDTQRGNAGDGRDRSPASTNKQPSSATSRDSAKNRGGAMQGSDRSGKSTRASSDRGRSSRGASSGGGSRPSGGAKPSGGSRGGGGRGGGGRR